MLSLLLLKGVGRGGGRMLYRAGEAEEDWREV